MPHKKLHTLQVLNSGDLIPLFSYARGLAASGSINLVEILSGDQNLDPRNVCDFLKYCFEFICKHWKLFTMFIIYVYV
jgi:hypothetical protein